MFEAEIQRGRSKQPLLIGGALVVIVAAIVLLVPMPRTVKSTFELVPAKRIEFVAPRDGVVAELLAQNGASVSLGAPLVKLDTSELDKQLATLIARQRELHRAMIAEPDPKAQAILAKADAAVTAATTALEKAKKGAAPAVAEAEKKLAAAQEAAAKARAEVGPSPEDAEREFAELQDKRLALEKQIADSTVLAPVSGVLAIAGLDKGAAVKTGAKLGSVDDHTRLKAHVKQPEGEPLKKGQGVELVLPGGKRRVTFDADAKDGFADSEFDNSKAPLAAGLSGEAAIEGEQRALLSR